MQLTCRQQYRKEGQQLFSISYIYKDTVLLKLLFLRLSLAPYLPASSFSKYQGFLAFSIFLQQDFSLHFVQRTFAEK